MQNIYETPLTLTLSFPRYELGGGPIRSFLLKLRDQSLTIISPPMGCNENDFVEIENLGVVKALVAPNKFHHMGIPQWKKRFPKAEIFTSQTALVRMRKFYSSAVQPIETWGTDSEIHFLSCPGTRNGEMLVVCKETGGWIWFITDLFFNYVVPPPNFFPRLMVQKVSGMGVVVNPFCRFLFVKNRTQVREWLERQMETFPPQVITFSHGEPINKPNQLLDFTHKARTYDR